MTAGILAAARTLVTGVLEPTVGVLVELAELITVGDKPRTNVDANSVKPISQTPLIDCRTGRKTMTYLAKMMNNDDKKTNQSLPISDLLN